MYKWLVIAVFVVACGEGVEPMADAADAGIVDATVADATSSPDAWVDADTRRPCSCAMPCQNGLCCIEGYCGIYEDDPLACVYTDVSMIPDAGGCE